MQAGAGETIVRPESYTPRMTTMTVEDIVRALGLEPLPGEGGRFRETYRAAHVVDARALPSGYAGPRATSTAIYYLLTPNEFSALHRVRGDEVFHFYLGDPVEMLQLHPGGTGRVVALGSDLGRGMHPQVVVPGGVWQGSRLQDGGRFALLGCTMAPGFDPADFELASRAKLVVEFPDFAGAISRLVRD
jgi:predicted cupin superfamily sugar epimerase